MIANNPKRPFPLAIYKYTSKEQRLYRPRQGGESSFETTRAKLGLTTVSVSMTIVIRNTNNYGPVSSIINLYCTNSIDYDTFSTANLLSELISVRDGLYDIPINLSKEDLLYIIEYICTC